MEHDDSDFSRETQASGELVPPPRKPPTAVGASTPAPTPFRGPIRDRYGNRITAPWSKIARDTLALAFDTLDAVADTIAQVTGVGGAR
jgi:hypothetical protein